MANGSPTRPSTSGVFSGLLLIVFGFLLLLHNYGRLDLGGVFRHWWPLIFIFWGGTKLYERTLAQRQGRIAGWITPGEVFLVIGLLVVVGVVVVVKELPTRLKDLNIDVGDPYSFDIDVPVQPSLPTRTFPFAPAAATSLFALPMTRQCASPAKNPFALSASPTPKKRAFHRSSVAKKW